MINPKNKSGFTLLELLIAISIFAILISLVGVNYRSDENRRRLKNQAQMVVDGLQKAQNMSLTGESVMIGGNATVPSYYRFELADCSNSCSYAITAHFINIQGTVPVVVSSASLGDLSIDTIPGGSKLTADFYPPRGKMVLVNGGSQNEVKIKLANSAGDAFCAAINSISGRMDIIAGNCQ